MNHLQSFMNYQALVLITLLFVTSCKFDSKSNLPNGDSTGVQTNEFPRKQDVVAKEIISIQYAFLDAVMNLNNTNASSFATKVKSLTDRVFLISKELDVLGPFPQSLREETLIKLNNAEKSNVSLHKNRDGAGTLKPEISSITNPLVNDFISAMTGVMMKAGL